MVIMTTTMTTTMTIKVKEAQQERERERERCQAAIIICYAKKTMLASKAASNSTPLSHWASRASQAWDVGSARLRGVHDFFGAELVEGPNGGDLGKGFSVHSLVSAVGWTGLVCRICLPEKCLGDHF